MGAQISGEKNDEFSFRYVNLICLQDIQEAASYVGLVLRGESRVRCCFIKGGVKVTSEQ